MRATSRATNRRVSLRLLRPGRLRNFRTQSLRQRPLRFSRSSKAHSTAARTSTNPSNAPWRVRHRRVENADILVTAGEIKPMQEDLLDASTNANRTRIEIHGLVVENKGTRTSSRRCHAHNFRVVCRHVIYISSSREPRASIPIECILSPMKIDQTHSLTP